MKVLIFDAYGTLFKVKIPLDALESTIGTATASFFDLWRNKTLEYTWLRSLMESWIPFDEVVKDALNYSLHHYNIDDEFIKTKLLQLYLDPVCFAEVGMFLQTHHNLGHTMAILSNGTPPMLNMGVTQNKIGTYFSRIFSANEVQIFKPSPKIYQLVHTTLPVQMDDVIFFSSNAWDVAGATKFGWKTIWVNRNKSSFDQLGVKPWREIRDLLEF